MEFGNRLIEESDERYQGLGPQQTPKTPYLRMESCDMQPDSQEEAIIQSPRGSSHNKKDATLKVPTK